MGFSHFCTSYDQRYWWDLFLIIFLRASEGGTAVEDRDKVFFWFKGQVCFSLGRYQKQVTFTAHWKALSFPRAGFFCDTTHFVDSCHLPVFTHPLQTGVWGTDTNVITLATAIAMCKILHFWPRSTFGHCLPHHSQLTCSFANRVKSPWPSIVLDWDGTLPKPFWTCSMNRECILVIFGHSDSGVICSCRKS